MKIDVSLGELVDKVSILEIKKEKIKNKNKLGEINKELQIISSFIPKDCIKEKDLLKKINLEIWDLIKKQWEQIEDYRDIELSKQVLLKNKDRFKIKEEINKKFNSKIKEVKDDLQDC